MFQDHRHATNGIEVRHVEFSPRLHVRDVRNVGTNPVEVGQTKVHPRFVGDGQQVKHGVR